MRSKPVVLVKVVNYSATPAHTLSVGPWLIENRHGLVSFRLQVANLFNAHKPVILFLNLDRLQSDFLHVFKQLLLKFLQAFNLLEVGLRLLFLLLDLTEIPFFHLVLPPLLVLLLPLLEPNEK